MDGGTVRLPKQPAGAHASPDPRRRILAVGNMYPPHHAGGYEVMWQAAMRHARSLGHEVRVLTSDYREAGGHDETDPDVHRTLRWYWDLSRYEFPRLNVVQRLQIERHNAAELSRHLQEFRPDLVSWWSMGCMSLALIEQVRRAGIPAVSVVHDDWLVYGRQLDQWIRMWRGWRKRLSPIVERAFGVPTQVDVSGLGTIVFNSRYMLEQARRAGIGSPEMTIVYPGIDEHLLEAIPSRPWRWELVCIGRIDRQKGVDTALNALVHLPEASLAVWGTGDDRYVAEMKERAADLGVGARVRFEGRADSKQLRGVYGNADAVLFPVRWEEPFGLVPLEAMGVGRPVVTTCRGGTAEFVRDGENALVFPVDDEVALAEGVRRLAHEPELRARLQQAGKRTAARYTVSRFAQLTVEKVVQAGLDGDMPIPGSTR